VALRREDRETSQLPLAWQRQAECKGPSAEAFFPPVRVETKDERDYREQRAKKICSGCAVVSACLEHALRNNENHGIWGGLNEAERRKLRAGE
jgi:WhiB family transcriptional regulator, redox-sensing transcriptional regulator